jgi:hypothetical protein
MRCCGRLSFLGIPRVCLDGILKAAAAFGIIGIGIRSRSPVLSSPSCWIKPLAMAHPTITLG